MLQRLKDRRTAGQGGFTLIELLVVIAILGIIAAVVVFSVTGIQDKGQGSACEIDERTLRTAEEAYAAQPAPGGGGGNYVNQDTTDAGTDLVPSFLSKPPKLHTVVADNTATPKTITITPVAGAGC